MWSNYYMLDLDKDIAFEIGRFYYGIRDYAHALQFYMESTANVGHHHVTFHNQGLCYYSQGQLDLALENFRKSSAMNADYEKARSWIEKVTKELREREGGGRSAGRGGEGPAAAPVYDLAPLPLLGDDAAVLDRLESVVDTLADIVLSVNETTT